VFIAIGIGFPPETDTQSNALNWRGAARLIFRTVALLVYLIVNPLVIYG